MIGVIGSLGAYLSSYKDTYSETQIKSIIYINIRGLRLLFFRTD